MKIIYHAAYARDVVGHTLTSTPEIQLDYAGSPDALMEQLADADALITVGPMYDAVVAQAVAASKTLRWIQTLSAGFETLQKLGVPAHVTVSNAGDSWSVAVAEHAMALTLALAKRISDCAVKQEKRIWDRQVMGRMSNLQGRTMVVVGYGSIGQKIAERAKAFGMRIVAVTRDVRKFESADEVIQADQLHTALGKADVVVITVPSQQDTVHLLNQSSLAACKQGCFVINVSRGNVVDQRALFDALLSGHLGGAGLDVTEQEPLPATDDFWNAPNLIISPHVAGGGQLVKENLAELVIDNIGRWKRNEALRFVVMNGTK